jgi:hypothetical protein
MDNESVILQPILKTDCVAMLPFAHDEARPRDLLIPGLQYARNGENPVRPGNGSRRL